MAYASIFAGTFTDATSQANTLAAQFVNGDQGYVTIDLAGLLNQVGLSQVDQAMVDFLNSILSAAGVPGISPAIGQGTLIGIGFTVNSPQLLEVLTAIAKFFQTYPLFSLVLTLLTYVGLTNLVGTNVQRQVGSAVGTSIFCTIGGALGTDCQTGQLITIAVGALVLIKALR